MVAWALVAPLGIWALGRLLGLERGFPLVAIVAFTPYAAAASLVAVALAAILRRWWALGAGLVVAATLLALVLPRALSGDQAPEPARGVRMTLMSANLHFGDADPGTVVELVREHGVDVLSFQELTPDAVRGLRRAGLESILPEVVRPSAAGAEGGGLYARMPLRPTGNVGLGDGFRQPGARMLGPIRADLVSVHPVPPTSAEKVGRWRGALRSLPPAGPGGPLRFLLGDFNATLDHAELRRVLDSGYVDAADVTGGGLSPTWQAGSWVPITIDHLLVDERVHVASYEVRDLPGSDHEALIAEVVVPAASAAPTRR